MQEESKVFRTFFYQGHRIRAIEQKGETWWVAADVCKVLKIANVSMAVSGYDGTGNTGLDNDEKDDIMIHDVTGRKQATLCVNEPGLYHLISKSRTPEAKAFGRWVRYEVLPGPRMLRNLPADQLRTMLQVLVTSGMLAIVQVGKAEHYRLP